jgi:hypothetical protein
VTCVGDWDNLQQCSLSQEQTHCEVSTVVKQCINVLVTKVWQHARGDKNGLFRTNDHLASLWLTRCHWLCQNVGLLLRLYRPFIFQNLWLILPLVITLQTLKQVKVISYTAWSNQDCSKRFIHYSWADVYNQTPSQLLLEASSHAVVNAWRLFAYKYPPLSIARYLFIQLSGLEQCRVNKLAKVLTPQHRIWTLGL